MTLSDPQTPGPADQGPAESAAPKKPRRTFNRRILAIVSGATLLIGLVLGGGVGVVIGATGAGDRAFDSSTMPGRGNTMTPDGHATPSATDDSSTPSGRR